MKKIYGVYALLVFVPISIWFAFNTSYQIEVVNHKESIAEAQVSVVGIKTITAYTLGRVEENDGDPCIGAYNDNLCELADQGIVICATRLFEKGTVLRIADIECIVLDKTSKKYADRVDVAMKDYQVAKQFGIKELPVAVVGTAIIK